MEDLTEKRKSELLKAFIKEFFDFNSLCKIGLFTKEMKNDYKEQEKRICNFMGLESIYEYGAKEIRCHITESVPNNNPFITVIPSIYE
jgi:hypothetical protein